MASSNLLTLSLPAYSPYKWSFWTKNWTYTEESWIDHRITVRNEEKPIEKSSLDYSMGR